MRNRVVTILAMAALWPLACKHADAPPLLLTANVVDPQDVNAVSTFNSCQGHAYPEQNSPNSGKEYFWPNSTNFSTNNKLKEFAACDGTVSQARDDTDANEQDRGQTAHLYCDNSSTSLRYFHLSFAPALLGTHVHAGDFLGYASMVGTGQSASSSWQFSSNFDIAVSDQDDSRTENYFTKLDAAAFAAWSARGLTSINATFNPANPVCTTYNATFAAPDIFFFSPAR